MCAHCARQGALTNATHFKALRGLFYCLIGIPLRCSGEYPLFLKSYRISINVLSPYLTHKDFPPTPSFISRLGRKNRCIK